jgi:hypothetical protein
MSTILCVVIDVNMAIGGLFYINDEALTSFIMLSLVSVISANLYHSLDKDGCVAIM